MSSNSKNLLIVYKRLPWHKDPDFDQFTYGDSKTRAKRIKKNLCPGGYVFFQTTKGGVRYITAYFKILEIITRQEAKNRNLNSDSRNDDVIIIGKKDESRVGFLLKFDRSLALKFKSIRFQFDELHSDNERINFHTRAQPYISDEDVRMLIDSAENAPLASSINDDLFGFDEIHNLKEGGIRDYLAKNPTLIEDGASYYDKELVVEGFEDSKNGRIDLVLKDKKNRLLILEFKKPDVASEKTIFQIENYSKNIIQKMPNCDFRFGVCIDNSQITPDLEILARERGIEIFYYGLGITVHKLVSR